MEFAYTAAQTALAADLATVFAEIASKLVTRQEAVAHG